VNGQVIYVWADEDNFDVDAMVTVTHDENRATIMDACRRNIIESTSAQQYWSDEPGPKVH
jgi:hypothetical protein